MAACSNGALVVWAMLGTVAKKGSGKLGAAAAQGDWGEAPRSGSWWRVAPAQQHNRGRQCASVGHVDKDVVWTALMMTAVINKTVLKKGQGEESGDQ
jgi:hypothetical protein